MRNVCSLLALFLLSTCAIVGQTVDTSILGRVTDPTGAAVVGAAVTIHSDATGLDKTATTGTSGEYIVQYLVPGPYTVTISAAGFAQVERKDIQLALQQQIHLDFSLSIGQSTQVVEVTTQQPLLQSENAALGTTVDTNRTLNLPLNGRRFNDLAVLTPGVVVSNPDNHTSSTAGSAIAATAVAADGAESRSMVSPS